MKQTEQAVLTWLDQHAEELYETLSELIRIPSVNNISHGDEVNCVPFVSDQYRALGLTPQVYCPDEIPGILAHPEYLHGRGTDKRPNISAVWKGRDSKRSVMLAAHTDTMPIGDESLWTVPPLGGLIRDGRIYGRGASDNKFGIASSIMAVKALQAAGVTLDNDVVLTSYCDEEYGGGGGALSACLKFPCDTYVNLDGGNYELWTRSIGGCIHRVTLKAQEPQDSAAQIINAMEEIRAALAPFEARRRAELHDDPYFKGSDMERSAFRILTYHAGNAGSDLDQGLFEFVYYTILPKEEIFAELQEIQHALSTRLKEKGILISDFTPTTRFFHSLTADEADPVIGIMHKAAEEASGRTVRRTGACLTDLSLFLKCGSPSSFNFGILRDFKLYGGAHQPDEFVECDAFLQITKALALFLIRWGNNA